jgi:cytochrome c553
MLGFALVTGLAALLIGKITLNSPDTHAHLWDTLRPEYDRTAPITVGQEFGDVDLTLKRGRSEIGNPMSVTPGHEIYLASGCATCHGLDARGGSVGPSLAGSFPEIVNHMVRDGPGGMPAYNNANITDADLATMSAYLRGLPVVKPQTQELLALQHMPWDPAISREVLLQGKAALRRSCGACHTQPTKEEILSAFGSDSLATGLVAQMVQNANVSLEDGKAIAHYMMAILHDADPVKEP